MLKSLFKNKSKPVKTPTKLSQESLDTIEDSPLFDFKPFHSLNTVNRLIVSNFAEQMRYKEGDVLFDIGMEDEFDYFLLNGIMNITSFDGREIEIDSRSPKSRQLLAFLRPRKHKATITSSRATAFKVPHNVVRMAVDMNRGQPEEEEGMEVIIYDMDQESLLSRVKQALSEGKLKLSSPPEVAIKVKAACSDDTMSLDAIGLIINRDVSMATKMLYAANCPAYRGLEESKSVSQAVTRLGKNLTQHLVFYYSAQELFSTRNPALRKAFKITWQSAYRRAVMAHTLAKLSHRGLNPETAFMGALLLRIGDLVILQYLAEEFSQESLQGIGNVKEYLSAELAKITQIRESGSARNSLAVLKDWPLPQEVFDIFANGGNWAYQSEGDECDYADLMIASNALLRIMEKRANGLPPYSSIPGLAKVMGQSGVKKVNILKVFKAALKDFEEMNQG